MKLVLARSEESGALYKDGVLLTQWRWEDLDLAHLLGQLGLPVQDWEFESVERFPHWLYELEGSNEC